MSDPVGFFVLCAFFLATGALSVLMLKAGGVFKVTWGVTVVISLALLCAAWFCLNLAASISASV